MAGKPAEICQLVKGKFIGNQKGFVETFNWLAKAFSNLNGGEGAEINWQDGTHPVINAQGGGGPFEGTDGTQTDGKTTPIKFASALDSNVVVTCAGDTITIGVYYV